MTVWSLNIWGDTDDAEYTEQRIRDFVDELPELEQGTLNIAGRPQTVFDPHSKLAIRAEGEML